MCACHAWPRVYSSCGDRLSRARHTLTSKPIHVHPRATTFFVRPLLSTCHLNVCSQATECLLRRWDLLKFDFDFEDGGGGGDPGGGGGGATIDADSRAAPSAVRDLDPRTAALDVHSAGLAHRLRRIAERNGEPPSPWVEKGSIPFDVLLMIDEVVRPYRLPHQAKRALTFERQLVALRKVNDVMREEKAAVELELVKLALQPQRERRKLEYERGVFLSFRQETAAAATEAAQQHATLLKELRAAAAGDRLQMQGDMRNGRIALEEQVTELQSEIKSLERRLKAAHSSSRTAEQRSASQLADAEAEVQRLQDRDRAWARVQEERDRVAGAHAARDAALARADVLEAQLGSRAAGRQAEHQELLSLRGLVKQLRTKVETYTTRRAQIGASSRSTRSRRRTRRCAPPSRRCRRSGGESRGRRLRQRGAS